MINILIFLIKYLKMKFIHYLENITGISVYPMTSFMVFFFFFLALIVYLVRADKKMVLEMKSIPLDKEPDSLTPSQKART